MKVIIAGSRTIKEYKLVLEVINESGFEVSEVVSGTAYGVDSIGEEFGSNFNIKVKQFSADWYNLDVIPCSITTNRRNMKYNRLAGFNRNEEMAKYADALILIWDGKSKGSADMLKRAKKHNLHIYEKIV